MRFTSIKKRRGGVNSVCSVMSADGRLEQLRSLQAFAATVRFDCQTVEKVWWADESITFPFHRRSGRSMVSVVNTIARQVMTLMQTWIDFLWVFGPTTEQLKHKSEQLISRFLMLAATGFQSVAALKAHSLTRYASGAQLLLIVNNK